MVATGREMARCECVQRCEGQVRVRLDRQAVSVVPTGCVPAKWNETCLTGPARDPAISRQLRCTNPRSSVSCCKMGERRGPKIRSQLAAWKSISLSLCFSCTGCLANAQRSALLRPLFSSLFFFSTRQHTAKRARADFSKIGNARSPLLAPANSLRNQSPFKLYA